MSGAVQNAPAVARELIACGADALCAAFFCRVIGRVQFRENGDLIDCAKMGVGGKAIPSSADYITDITGEHRGGTPVLAARADWLRHTCMMIAFYCAGDAEFVLLVEKDAAFMRLAEDRFYNDYPCIIITAKGQPDVGTRLFLKKVRRCTPHRQEA